MNPSREEALFVLALEKPAAERAAFLELICGEDRALRARIEALLVAHEQTEGVLAEASAAAAPTMKIEHTEAPDETIGQKIGRYKILEKVGEGGCGVVYVAEQTEPVRRRVALKVIKLGMDTKQVVARFEAERQALAMMDHPNIARVLDAGSTETGRPYFIMELVRGIKITDYCDQEKVPTHERLELFIQICHAIQHAHQKGIIHRDIKPSNILVTLHDPDRSGVPKVIDFGIAKATEGRLTDATVYTQLHQFIGTPAYMSPEQAEMSGLDVDTRSDIYSLGVLLYELLTGKTPFDGQELMSQGIDAMRKTIREKDPVRPSTKLATLQGDELTMTAKRHSVDRSKLLHQLKGDLDWIVMKCLEKDRKRRYETANGLAMDLKRHLNNETVVARPPSKLYEFQRTVRRHKVGFAATAAIIAALAIGVVISTWQTILATHAKRAALEAQASETVQRQKAEANEQKAVQAQAAESKLREQAQAQELAARQRAYASDMNVAKQALDASNLGRALELLDRQRPLPGQKDLRGWEWRYLWKQTRSDALFTLCQMQSEIGTLSASADGKLLAIGARHKAGASVWDIQRRQEIAQLAPGEEVTCVAFSPVESVLAFGSHQSSASGEEHCTLRLWNSATRQMLVEVPLDHPCIGLSFAHDGKSLVTSTESGHITLWRVPEMTKLRSIPNEQYALLASPGFAATPDLSLAACADGDGQVHVVDPVNGKELWTAKAAKMYVTALAFSPDGRVLASAEGFNESDIRLWDTATGKEIGQLTGHTAWVGSMVFWPDGKKMASCSADQTLRIWDMASRKCVDVMRGHQLEVWRLTLLPDEKTLVSGCKDGTVCLWNASITHDRRESLSWEGIAGWRFTPDNRSMVTIDFDGQVTRWSGHDFQWKEPLFNAGVHQVFIRRSGIFRFSREGNELAVGSTNGTVSVWDVLRGVLQCQLALGGGITLPVCFLAERTKLICWSEDGNRFSEWDLKANREIQAWPAPENYYYAFGPTVDEKQVVSAGLEGDFTMRNLLEHSTTNLPLHALECWSIDFSPDDRHLVVSSAMGFARVWETGTWREEATLRGFLKSVNSAVFSPNCQRLATGGSIPADAVKLWAVDSWQELITLKAKGSQFSSTMFSPDGSYIGTLSTDGFLHVWHAPSWAEIHAAEAKDPPAPGYGATGKLEGQQP